MRTTLELPDPLFARLKARASTERLTLKQLLHSYVEQGLNATPSGSGSKTFGPHPAAPGGALGHRERTPQQRGPV